MPKKAVLLSTERPIKSKLGPVTSPNLLGDVMSSISRHLPSLSLYDQSHRVNMCQKGLIPFCYRLRQVYDIP